MTSENMLMKYRHGFEQLNQLFEASAVDFLRRVYEQELDNDNSMFFQLTSGFDSLKLIFVKNI